MCTIQDDDNFSLLIRNLKTYFFFIFNFNNKRKIK
jgi:hypothetical protein